MNFHNQTKELLERHPWLCPAVYVFTFVIFLIICLGFGALSIACCLCFAFLGASIATWIANDSNGRFLYPLVNAWLSQRSSQKGEFNSPTDPSEKKNHLFPWKEAKVPASVNDAIETLLDQLIDTYVNDWYESGISRDRDFLNEIRHQARFACSQLLCKLATLDLPTLLAEDVLPTAALHMHRIINLEDDLSEKMYPRSLLETSICDVFPDLHFCLGSRKNELDYLRQVADFLITKLLDDTHLAGRAHDDDGPSRLGENTNMSTWPSQSVRHFTRELIVNTLLLPCLDLIADPDTINHLLIIAFDAQKGDISGATPSHDSDATTVPFLTNFAEHTAQIVPDSLLQLKLSEVLRDARQYSTFRLYLQDTRGPVNELCFLAEASRIHSSMQRKAESSSQIAYDIWQLFGQFVHDSAPDRIEFDAEIVQEFKTAVECNNLPLLDKVVETSYQLVYQRMQNEHIIPFCQSDYFLGYLCGSPPVCVNELIDQQSMPRKASVSGGTFSLAQFRSRLRKAIAVVSLDGSLDNEESLNNSLADEDDDISSSCESAPPESCVVIDANGSTSSGSFPHLSLPSIDVSVIGDVDNISPASGYSGTVGVLYINVHV
ncbi:hypothetical protein RB195_016733 [Necator americanus]|uniref:PXA domain-containing protein n=1 Tax=Necator americanus TaxID=51031 RepID=A0ABR1C5K8_NECAM